MEIWVAILTGGVAAGVFKIIDSLMQRKFNKCDKKDAVKEALKVILLDRILYLGRAYIRTCKVDADDRRRLIEMHRIYHNLGGNGDADLIMSEVKELQLKS
jgi:hypothetical protein